MFARLDKGVTLASPNGKVTMPILRVTMIIRFIL